MNNLIDIAQEMIKKNKEIDKIRADIRQRGENKSLAMSNYECEIAKVIIQLKNGVELEHEGELIKNPANTIIEKIARGICWHEKLEMEKAEALYKSAITNLQAIMAQLNALQSLFRHLDKS